MHTIRSLIFLLLVFAATTPAEAARQFGVGIIVAGPTGLTAQWRYAKNRDISTALGWGQDGFHLNIDHLWNRRDWVKADGVPINFYYGAGLRWDHHMNRLGEESTRIGLRVPVGVQHIFREAPIQIFFEIAPHLILIDHTSFGLGLALGARYFF